MLLIRSIKGFFLTPNRKKSSQIQANGTQGLKNCITSLWGPKALDNVVPLSLSIDVDPDAASLRKRGLVERYPF